MTTSGVKLEMVHVKLVWAAQQRTAHGDYSKVVQT